MTQKDKEQILDEKTQTDSEQEARINALARKYRHIGFSIFGGLAAVLAMFLLYSALTSLNRGEVYDPFTGEKVLSDTADSASK